MCAVCAFSFAGCASGAIKTPEELIKNAYGDKEYRISFSSEGLDEPIGDLTYTAKSIPVLPSPQKVGYVFAGWYFDKEYQTQYQDNLLLMTMADVTLYAKWGKEDFSANGTYDVEFEANILEETIKEGKTAAQFGGYKKFPENISAENTYIEKSDGELLLKIVYDCVDPEPYGSLADSYSVTVNATKNPSSVYIKERVNSFSDTVKTIYIRITDADLSAPLYLDIETTDWKTEGLSDEERYGTTTSYTVEFKIKRLIGFKTPYVDTSVPLENGYYLVRSYFKTEKNASSMGDGFNSVFSYIKAENGKYKLIKPFTPYAGLVKFANGRLEEPYSVNMFYRMMSFMPMQYCFEVDTSDYTGEVESDYYPEAYKAKKYVDYSVEFHTSDYKIYSIIDLGTNFKREFALMYSVSGFMEVAGGMGSGIEILYMDYDHIIKLADEDVDYKELSGDAYTFKSQESFYAGSASDLNSKNLLYGEVTEHGLSTKMINFIYSAKSADAPYKSRTIYDGKITFSPDKETNSKNVADARYEIARFNVSASVYGYDAVEKRKDGEELYYDSMSVQTFGSNGLRESGKLRVGKTFGKGEIIRLQDLFREKVSETADYSTVKSRIYAMNGGNIDFSREQPVSEAFAFSSDCAVLFAYEGENGKTNTCLVELVEKSGVDYRISDETRYWSWSEEYDAYVSSAIDKEGSSVDLPAVTYSWNGVAGVRFRSSWYDDESCINPLHVGVFANENGVYKLTYIGHQDKAFTVSGYETYVLYELVNVYGEIDFIRFRYVTTQKETYRIEADNGEVLSDGDVTYDEYGKRKDVRASESVYLTAANFAEKLSRKFTLELGDDISYALNISRVTFYLTDGKNRTTTVVKEADGDLDINALTEEIRGYMNEYSWFSATVLYKNFGDEFESRYIYNVSFSGEKTTKMLKFDSYFTNTLYTMSLPRAYSDEGYEIAASTVNVQHYLGGKRDNSFYASRTYKLTKGDYEYSLTFNEAGEFYVEYGFRVNGISFYFGQRINALSDKCDVVITYVTDEAHAFLDGLTERSVTYNLSENIKTLNAKEFFGNDILFGWTQSESRDATERGIVAGGNGISDFISKYNAQSIVLYAVWDGGVSVTAKAEGNADRTKHYFRDSSTGYYIIDLASFNAYAPAGYVLAGWTGGFIGDEVKTGKIYLNDVSFGKEFFTITAVYKKKFTVKYSINSEYSNTVLKNDEVIDGEGLDSDRRAVADEGFKFVGWFVSGDESRTLIDLSSYKFTADTVLVAKFIDAEGNEIW